MSTGLIVAIVVVVLILLGLALLLPRMRSKAQERKAEKQLAARREEVATEHRGEAEARSSRADEAERQAVAAQQAAQAERARAEQHEQQAQLHERGLADDELMADGAGRRPDGGPPAAARTDDPDARPGGAGTHREGREDQRDGR